MKVIITGATGMVGKGVLLECLESEKVEAVLIINRSPIGLQHPKMKEIIHSDFFDLSAIEDHLKGYDACFFCLGVSSFRMTESDYTRLTYDLTMNFGKTLLDVNKEMTFNFVSGAGTDSTEKGKTMWARVKGKTENGIYNLGFNSAYAFRPAYIKPGKDTPTKTPIYKIMIPILSMLHPIIKTLFPRYTTTTSAIGQAMINVTINGYPTQHLEVDDINLLSEKKI